MDGHVFNNSKGALFFICLFAFIQGTSVNGLVNVSLTSIENRFDLPSSSLGIIKGSYDVAYSVLALFVTYHASTGGSKPKWLSLGVFVLGIGSLTFAIPHFVTGRYVYGAGVEDTCSAGGNTTTTDCEENTNLSSYFYVFVLAQLIHGLGATPLYTIGVSYLDENVDTVNSGLYIGIFYACAFFGPATGYFFGGKLLDIFTDIYKGNDGSELTPDDPRWVGAWWMGFVVCAALSWAVSFPLAGYPKELPGAAEINAKKRSEAHQKGGEDIVSTPDFGKTWRDFPTALLLLLRNPTFMLINIGGAFEAFLSATFAAFGPKFVQMQFGQPSGRASMLFGKTKRLSSSLSFSPVYIFLIYRIQHGVFRITRGTSPTVGRIARRPHTFQCGKRQKLREFCVLEHKTVTILILTSVIVLSFIFATRSAGFAIIPGAAVGSVLGGLLMQKLKLKCPGMIKLVMIGGALGFILDFALLLSCPDMPFAGVTVAYPNNSTSQIPMTTNLSDSCNADCNCKTAFLVPTCGADNVQYFSPCFAGCSGESTDDNGIKRYTNCSCVSTNMTGGSQDAYEKSCPSPSCGRMSVFLFLFFLLMVVTIMEIPAATGATLRCVPESQRSLALGVQTIILRFLGSIPGPIVFGRIIDSTCLLWQEKCGERGSCWLYDKESMAVKFLMVALIWQALSLVGFALALWSYKPPLNTTVTQAKLTRLYGSQEPTVTVTPSGGGAEYSSETATPI
ncbi:solute carrier organic anion transporter family member 4C1-like [Branchiostoma lanceolatum]|uniref:solute carrier organic anion transporter family member 4C1-like n=1 Tax=Branchiostoma lanceolatum TaxID=7740 RepID=UPI003454898E